MKLRSSDDRKLDAILVLVNNLREDLADERRRERDSRKRLEAIVTRALEQLPDLTRQATERATYELRTARWEAHKAGAPSGLPLPPPPPTPSFADVVRDPTRPFMLTHGDETYVKWSGLVEVARKLWPIFTVILAGAAWVYTWLVAHGVLK